jgi:hypothetical protein
MTPRLLAPHGQLVGSRVGLHRPHVQHVADQVVVGLKGGTAVRLGPEAIEHFLGRMATLAYTSDPPPQPAACTARMSLSGRALYRPWLHSHSQPASSRDRSPGKLPGGQRRPRSTTATSTPRRVQKPGRHAAAS